MKNKLLGLLITFLITGQLNGQTVDWQWAKSAGGTSTDYVVDITTDVNGNVYMTGYFNSSSITFGSFTLNKIGSEDVFVVKYDPNGNVLWAKNGGGTGTDYAIAISLDNNNNVFITGYYYSSTITFGSYTLNKVGSFDIFIVKYDTDGNVIWAKTAGGTGYDGSRGISNDKNGNVYVTGHFENNMNFGSTTLTSIGGWDIFVAKYDSNGNFLWARSDGGSGSEMGWSISSDSSDNVCITGEFYSPSITFGSDEVTNKGSSDVFIVKYDTDGNVVWAKSAGGSTNDVARYISNDKIGNFYITGFFESNTIIFGGDTLTNAGGSCSGGCSDIFVVKYDPDGNVVWAKNSGGASDDEGRSVFADTAGNVFLTGYFQSNTITFGTNTLSKIAASDIFVVKYDSDGNVVWAKSAGSTSWDRGVGISEAKGDVYVAGEFYSSSINFGNNTLINAGIYDLFIAKLSCNSLSTINIRSCNSFTVPSGDEAYTVSGTYLDTIPNTIGCDSIITIHLIIDDTIPLQPDTISGNTNVCSGTTHTYSISSVSDATSYTWSVPSGATINSGQGTTSISATYGTSSGDISVTSNNTCGSSVNQTLSITVNSIPALPTAISGNTTVCLGTTHTYSISSVSGATGYTWSVPSGATINNGQGTTSISITYGTSSGNVSVTANNACGSSSPQTLSITVNSAPAQPGSVSGITTVCSGTTHTYSISSVSGATGYTWSVPSGATINSGQGTASISVTYGTSSGDISVTADNACGSSTAQTLSVSVVTSVPAQPGTISGTTTICSGTTHTYSISAVSGATGYTWSVPSGATINSGQGTTSISVTYSTSSGNVSVTADNVCGSSAAQSVSITVNTAPAQPNAISGTTTVCSGTTHTYSISSVSGATGYTWSAPSGATINSGQGTTSISVTYGTSSGNVSVTADNACGSSTAQTKSVTVNAYPGNAVTQSGNTLTATETGATYQWLDCNNGNAPISGATSQSYTPTVSGSYAVEVTKNSCSDTSSCMTVTTTSISENSFGSNLILYPNPTTGQLTIQLGDFVYSDVTVIVRNVIGQEIMRKNYTSANKLVLTIEGEASIYLVEITTADKRAVLKVIKE